MKNIKLFILAISLVLFIGTNAYSQKDSSRSKDKLKKVVKEKLMERVGLDESTADKLIEMTAENRKLLKDLQKKRKEIAEYIFDNPDNSDMGSKLDELFDIETKINKARSDHYLNLKSFLTPSQIAKSMVFQKDLLKFMKKEMDKKKKGKKNRDKGDDNENFNRGEERPDFFE